MTGARAGRPAGIRLAAIALSVVSIVVVHASSPVFWRVSTQEEFLRGEADNVSIDADGQLTLAPAAEVLYDAAAPLLWSVALDGGTLWIGGGGDGRVFRVGPDGAGSTVFEADEQNVHAVHPTGPGEALVGTSPDGSVLRVRDGRAETVFDPDERYVWAIADDGAGGAYVATGDPGRIHRIAQDGETSLFYDAGAAHVLALAFDPDGNLLAGTGSPGQVVRIGRDGRGFVLLDSPYAEIRALRAAAGGALYAVAVGRSPARSRPAPPPAPAASPSTATVSTTTTVTAVVTGDAARAPAAPPPPPPAPRESPPERGAVYRIDPDGVWTTVWESSDDTPYDVAPDADGGLIIGTGGDGKLFRVSGEPPRVELLKRVPARQVTAFAAGADGVRYYVTANPGKLYRLAAGRAPAGTYVSEVRDAKTVAAWGALRWRAATPGDSAVRLFTRSGNTSAPNAAWSPWSSAYTDPDGSQIASPRARYLQWKAELGGESDTPTVRTVTAAYLPQNLRPEFTALTVHEPGVAFQRPYPSNDPPIDGLDEGGARTGGAAGAAANGGAPQAAARGRRVHRKGLRTFVWTARDPNGDALRFDVLYRAETDARWRTLRTGLARSIFAWDTTSAPDGAYLVRIVASDAASNAPGAALEGLIQSTPFDVDNSPPRIDVEAPRAEADRAAVAFTVSDSHSPVRNVEYSLDAEHWRLLHPLDGIADSRTERFRVTIARDQLPLLAIRAADAMDNVATAGAR